MITHKHESPPRSDREQIQRIAYELSTCTDRLIVVLGGGAHGHQAALKYGYGSPSTDRGLLLTGLPTIRHNMTLLSLEVEQILRDAGIPAVVIPPFCIALMRNGSLERFDTAIIHECISAGLVPVTHGDVCFDRVRGASILSGDSIMTHLSREFLPRKVIIGTDVDGLYDKDPHLHPHAQLIPVINRSNRSDAVRGASSSLGSDVTGGMARKVAELLQMSDVGCEVIVLNLTVPGRLKAALAGEMVIGTRVICD